MRFRSSHSSSPYFPPPPTSRNNFRRGPHLRHCIPSFIAQTPVTPSVQLYSLSPEDPNSQFHCDLDPTNLFDPKPAARKEIISGPIQFSHPFEPCRHSKSYFFSIPAANDEDLLAALLQANRPIYGQTVGALQSNIRHPAGIALSVIPHFWATLQSGLHLFTANCGALPP